MIHLTLPLTLALASVAPSFGAIASFGPNQAQTVQKTDIVETAIAAGNFQTLVAGVQAAGLVSTLQSEGPFTVFAPTDAAFAALPEGTLAFLLQPENQAQLTDILTYHVLAGSFLASDVVQATGFNTVNGQRLDVKVSAAGVMIDNAQVIVTDIICSNGVIHVLDAVMLPATDSIVETARSTNRFETLLAAAQAAGLADFLEEEGPLTILAPTDLAFAALPEGTVEFLLRPENSDLLVQILTMHVVRGRVYSPEALRMKELPTLEGTKVRVSRKKGRVYIGDGKLLKADIDAYNGVIHVINRVILPSA
jgi:uncharacterized surface protein with fasciclin (FAS1) repeats